VAEPPPHAVQVVAVSWDHQSRNSHQESVAAVSQDQRPRAPAAKEHPEMHSAHPDAGASHQHLTRPPAAAPAQISLAVLHTAQVRTTSRSDPAMVTKATPKSAARAHE